MYETILSPVNYGGLQLKNRIIFAPTTFGLPDEEYLAEIRRLAEGGCAMLIIGDVPVGKSMFEKSLFDAKGFAFYQQIVEIAHKADCKVCAQLHQSDSNMLAMLKYIPAVLTKKLTPDQLREKLNAEVEPYITKMPKRKIEAILAGFGKAAALAKQAGFDMVQVHGDRMCGSFSSSIFNHRTDEYGGSAENRARFAVEAVKAVHAAVPEFPIDYKLAVRQEDPHYGNAGVLVEELPVFVPLLEQAGVTVDYQEITPEIDKDPVLGAPVVAGQLGRHPDTKVIIVDHGSLTAQMGNHLKNAGVKPNTVYVAGFSLSPATAAAIENGYVQLVSEAQPYVMGYFGVVQTVLSKKYGFTGFSIDTGGGIVDAANIGAVSAFAKQGLR